jgi:hypothetical protein
METGQKIETLKNGETYKKVLEESPELLQKVKEGSVDQKAIQEKLKESGIKMDKEISQEEMKELLKAPPSDLQKAIKSGKIKSEDLETLKSLDLQKGELNQTADQQKILEALKSEGMDISMIPPAELKKLESGVPPHLLRQAKAFERYAKDFSDFLTLGDRHFEDERYLQAESAYRQAWRRANDLKSWQACLLIGERFITLTQRFKLTGGKVQTAANCFEDAKRYALKDRNPEALEKIAVGFALLGEEQTAEELRREASRIREQ